MLLHRPPRKYAEGADGGVLLQWADGGQRLDAARITGLRYFTRDTGVSFASTRRRGGDTAATDRNGHMFRGRVGVSPWRCCGRAGLAAWNDFNDVAKAARKTLVKAAARIEIPNRAFVIWVMAAM